MRKLKLENLHCTVLECDIILGRPFHIAAIWLWGSQLAPRTHSNYSQSRLYSSGCVPALWEPIFWPSAPISSSGSESWIVVLKKQIFLVEVDIAAEPDLEIWLHESHSSRTGLGPREQKFRLPTSSHTSSRAESHVWKGLILGLHHRYRYHINLSLST